MLEDEEFLEFVRISQLFHKNVLGQLNRALTMIFKAKNLVAHELNYAKYGTPKRKEVSVVLEGFQNADDVLVSGEFNNWRPDGAMIRTPEGWERRFDLFPGSYEYKFIIVHKDSVEEEIWMMDPANPDSAFVPDVGVYNSVLTVSE